jgi:arginyl-tRNA synthetase
MPIQDLDGEAPPEADAAEEDEEREKVIVRSNGVVTYVGKDIAYQFWKLGLLGRDFHYRVFADRPQGPLWATTSDPGMSSHPEFGGAAYVYNVIDVRQSYLQKLLKQALVAVGHPEGAERSHHFSYEMVALSHATAQELGHAPDPTPKRRSVPSWRCQAGRGWVSRPTTCLTRSFARPPWR